MYLVDKLNTFILKKKQELDVSYYCLLGGCLCLLSLVGISVTWILFSNTTRGSPMKVTVAMFLSSSS